MISIARSSSSASQHGSQTHSSSQPDFIPLGDTAPDTFYTLDTTGDSTASAPPHDSSFECPDHIEDMQVIVRTLRQTRRDLLRECCEHVSPFQANKDISSYFTHTITPSLEGTNSSADHRGANNYIVRNARDLYADLNA
jgi:hypothetical protein